MARVLLAVLLLAGTAYGAPLAVGDPMPPLALEDQHGRAGNIGEGVRVVVVSRDMEAGDVVKKALAGRDQAFLDANGAVYVANISGMPALVTRLFALPRMRERPYRMLLDRDGAAMSDEARVEIAATAPAWSAVPFTVRAPLATCTQA